MAKHLGLKSVDAEDGCITLNFATEKGRDYQFKVTTFDLATLLSAIHAAQAKALGQIPAGQPAEMAQVQGAQVLVNDEDRLTALRLFISDFHYHDYVTSSGSPLAKALDAFSEELGRQMKADPNASWAARPKN